MSDSTDISAADYEWMMELVKREGLCSNCFHTLACCNGACKDSDMTHVCKPNP